MRRVSQSIEVCFCRTYDGPGADLVLDLAREREVIEIKLTSGPTTEVLARLGRVAGMLKATRPVLLCRVARSLTTGDPWVTTLREHLRGCTKGGRSRTCEPRRFVFRREGPSRPCPHALPKLLASALRPFR